jgi:hypothetical protein
MERFTEIELKLLNKMLDFYWEHYNADHKENLDDWKTTFTIVKKLTI